MRVGPGVASVAACLAVTLMTAGCGTSSAETEAPGGAAVPQTPLEGASQTCDAGQVADNGGTLIIDTKGEEDTTGDSYTELACLLVALETPSSVITHMDSTRALDGMQTNSWGEFDARWTYHPNVGMNLTITLSN